MFDSVTGNRKSKCTTNYTELEDTTLVVLAMVVPAMVVVVVVVLALVLVVPTLVVVVLALVLVVPTLVVVVLILLDPTQSNTCVHDHMGFEFRPNNVFI
jgi:hypothetical protein